MTGYIYSSCGFGESTQDVVYGGNALVYENGALLAQGERFSLDPQMVIARLMWRNSSERRTNSTYVNAQRNIKSRFSADSSTSVTSMLILPRTSASRVGASR